MKPRLIVAVLVAPLITSALFAVALPYRTVSVTNVAIVFLLYAAFAYVGEAILGFPAFLVFRFFRWQGFIAHGLGGTVIGFVAISLIAVVYSPFSKVTLGEFLFCVAAGAVTGLAFRFIAGRNFQNRKPALGGETQQIVGRERR